MVTVVLVVTDVTVTNDVTVLTDGGSVTVNTFVTVASAVASTADNASRCCSVIMTSFDPPTTAKPMMVPISAMKRMIIIIRYLRSDDVILAERRS